MQTVILHPQGLLFMSKVSCISTSAAGLSGGCWISTSATGWRWISTSATGWCWISTSAAGLTDAYATDFFDYFIMTVFDLDFFVLNLCFRSVS